jgi:HAD superfamily hydrolase (TIGR01450 family)
VLLLDAYGVLVSSTGALPGAAEFIARLNRERRRYLLVTNDASKLPETAAARYRGFGLALDAERIVTSGSLLAPYFAAHGLAGAAICVLGPRDSLRYVETAGGRVVPADGAFDALVIGDESGFPFLETVDAAFSSLVRMIDAGRTPRLLLPNPDLVYPRGDGAFGFASGTVACMFERYRTRADLVFARLGKPHPAIFEEAEHRSGTRNMVMIGDQLDTDIRGACDFGIDSALIEGGVSATIDDVVPTWRLRSLA